MSLRKRIEGTVAARGNEFSAADRTTFAEFLDALNRGEIRAAQRSDDGRWHANAWVKAGILLGFRMGQIVDMSLDAPFRFFDKDTFPTRRLTLADRVRVVPGGTTIRDGCYVAPGVVCMPPTYVNVGSHIEEGTLLDSHVLVGSCAQIGKRVHLSAAAQIGGVLEPVGATPVIIEDDVLVGGGCGVYEGTVVRQGVVLAAGTVLTGSTPVYDAVRDEIYRRSPDGVLEIPARAVVVPGARPLTRHEPARRWNLSVYTPIIVKYRDAKTDASALLEEALR